VTVMSSLGVNALKSADQFNRRPHDSLCQFKILLILGHVIVICDCSTDGKLLHSIFVQEIVIEKVCNRQNDLKVEGNSRLLAIVLFDRPCVICY